MLIKQNGMFLHGADAISHQFEQRFDIQKSFDFDRKCQFDSLNNKNRNDFDHFHNKTLREDLIMPKINPDLVTLPKLDMPKQEFNFIKDNPLPFNDFDFRRKKYFDGGAVNIIKQQQQMMGPPPGSPPIFI